MFKGVNDRQGHRFLRRAWWRDQCRLIALAVALVAGLDLASAADGQAWKAAVWDSEAIYRGATISPDLVLPDVAETVDRLTSPRMALIKPAGSGPFPAIVLLHQCSGLNVAVAAWARAAVSHGYVVLIVDSLGSRSVKSVCFGPQHGVNFFRGARDALQAAEDLRRLPYVDPQRVALVGFSWGAMVGLLAASSHYVGALKSGPGFAAVASFYPGCFRITPKERPPYDLVNEDVSRPLLILMGDADTETPAQECLDKLEIVKRGGTPVEWHLYAGATHCWDCQHRDGFSKIDARGSHVTYHFRQDVTDDSRRRLFEFLDRAMPRRP